MSAILIIGDLHLGAGTNNSKQSVGTALNSRIIDQLNLLNWILEQALINNVNNIIFTGDTFEETKPHYTLVALFFEWLKKCVDNNINIHIVAGNHDLLRSGQFTTSSLDILNSIEMENVFFYKKNHTLELNNISFTFLPFRDRRSFNTNSNTEAINLLSQQIPYELASIKLDHKKIIVGHLALEGSIPVGNELGELSNELFCPLNMFAGYDYVFMGHIHKWQIMSEIPHIIHTGSLDISNFGEADHIKYITLLDHSLPNFHKYIEVPTRRLKSINIEIPDHCTDPMEFIKNSIDELGNIKDATVRVNITLTDVQSYSIDRSKIENLLSNLGVFHITRIAEQRKLTSVKNQLSETIDNTVNEVSAIQMYSSLVDENIRDEFIKTASSLIKEYQENLK